MGLNIMGSYNSFHDFCRDSEKLNVNTDENYIAYEIKDIDNNRTVMVYDKEERLWCTLDRLYDNRPKVTDVKICGIFPDFESFNSAVKNESRNVGYLVMKLPIGTDSVHCYLFMMECGEWINKGEVEWSVDSTVMRIKSRD